MQKCGALVDVSDAISHTIAHAILLTFPRCSLEQISRHPWMISVVVANLVWFSHFRVFAFSLSSLFHDAVPLIALTTLLFCAWQHDRPFGLHHHLSWQISLKLPWFCTLFQAGLALALVFPPLFGAHLFLMFSLEFQWITFITCWTNYFSLCSGCIGQLDLLQTRP